MHTCCYSNTMVMLMHDRILVSNIQYLTFLIPVSFPPPPRQDQPRATLSDRIIRDHRPQTQTRPTTLSPTTPAPSSRFAHPNPFQPLPLDPFLISPFCLSLPKLSTTKSPSPPLIADIGRTGILLRFSNFPRLQPFFFPKQLPTVSFTLPDRSLLPVGGGGLSPHRRTYSPFQSFPHPLLLLTRLLSLSFPCGHLPPSAPSRPRQFYVYLCVPL